MSRPRQGVVNIVASAAVALLLPLGGAHGEEARVDGEKEMPSMSNERLQRATFAGGCFWCMEPPFDKIEGVVSTTSGYTGGSTENPSYEQVVAGGTGHAEAVQVVFDPGKTSYAALLEVFWRNIDPTTANRQFCDVGEQYRTAIFYHDEEQKRLAEQSKKTLEKSGRVDRVVTEIAEASQFYEAEAYHQDYYKKNPFRYEFYRYTCGRDKRLDQIWGKDRGG